MSIQTAPADDSIANPATIRAWAMAAAGIVAAIIVSYFFFDRPLSRFVYDHFHAQQLQFRKLTYISEIVQAASVFVILWCVLLVARRRPLGPRLEPLARAAAALCVTVAAKDQFKYAFGRTWPETWINNNPSYIGNGTFGFFPFHGGTGWTAFPSGHTATIAAVAGALWVLWPRGRPIYALAVALVVAGLLGADYHWLSDVIAGGALGAAIGVAAARVGRA